MKNLRRVIMISHSTTANEKQQMVKVIDPSNFDASQVSVEQAFQWGRYAFQQDGADIETEAELINIVLPSLLDQMPPRWKVGFSAGFVSAFLDEQRCFLSLDQQEAPR
jgi:hypothetical protein